MKGCVSIKVRGYHLDFYGHVNNARYLEFLEEARWSYFEDEVDLTALRERGLVFVVVRIAIDFRRPVVLGDALEIETQLDRLSGKSGMFVQKIRRGSELVAEAEVTFALIEEKQERAVPIEGDIRHAFESMAKKADRG